MGEGVIGWDIGGAHLKAAYLDGRGAVQRVVQLPCPLWQGLPHLDRALDEALRQMPARVAKHAITMTGELVDLFATRADGVVSLIASLAAKLPPKFADDPDLKALAAIGPRGAVTIVHFIYRRKNYETQSKDYEFSRHSVEDHWAAGLQDVQISLKHPVWLSRHRSKDAVRVFDLTQDDD